MSYPFHLWWKAFRHFWKLRWLRHQGKLPYPSELVAHPSYVASLNIIDLINTCPDLGIIRRVDLSFDKAFTNLNILREDAINSAFELGRIPGMSMNMLGKHFKPEHIVYCPKPPGSNNWDGSSFVFILDYADCIEQKDKSKCCSVYFFCKEIHGITFPSAQPVNKDSVKLLEKLNLEIPKGATNVPITCYTEIMHRPTLLNYWHVEFLMFGADQPITKAEGVYRKVAATYARDHILSICAKASLANHSIIPDALYQRH